jgi:hypothetical protein
VSKLLRSTLAMLLLAGALAAPCRAEFIGNAFGGRAEETTRAAAAAAFRGFESFYAGMALLERRARSDAKGNFVKAAQAIGEARKGYTEAASLIEPKPISANYVSDGEFRFMAQFLDSFGLQLTRDTLKRDLLVTYAKTFERTEKLVGTAADKDLALKDFQETQSFINRQIIVGTFITNVLKD